jgi:hypothetical protein
MIIYFLEIPFGLVLLISLLEKEPPANYGCGRTFVLRVGKVSGILKATGLTPQ